MTKSFVIRRIRTQMIKHKMGPYTPHFWTYEGPICVTCIKKGGREFWGMMLSQRNTQSNQPMVDAFWEGDPMECPICGELVSSEYGPIETAQEA